MYNSLTTLHSATMRSSAHDHCNCRNASNDPCSICYITTPRGWYGMCSL